MDPLLTTDGRSDQTMMCVVSGQCAKATGGGVGALDNGKGMITGVIG
jgi:hypothetical protein